MSRLPPISGGSRRRGIAFVAALSVGQAASAGMAAFATRDAFAALHAGATAPPMVDIGLIALSGLTIAALRVAERITAERIGQDYAAAVRQTLFRHLSRLPARTVARSRGGSLALRFVGDLGAIRAWVGVGIARLISAAVVLPAATATIVAMNPFLGIAAAMPIALGLIAMAALGVRYGEAHRLLRSRRARIAADMSERIPHAPELRLLGRLRTERRLLRRRTERLISAAVRRARGVGLLLAVPDAVSGIAAAAVLLAAGMTGAAASEAAGALAALGLMIHPLRALSGVWDRHRAWIAARDKCRAVLDRPPLRRDPAPRAPLSGHPPALRFERVRAGALQHADFSVDSGHSVAILGPNGAGKSTLLALAAGLDAPTRGRVRIETRAPTGLTTAERRRLIAYVGPRSPTLAGSFRRALTLGCARRPSDEDILATARAFGLGPVLDRLGGLDGRVAEGGRSLSAGEARRVLLARATLSGARLLLLDEPDDALDADAPALVARLLRGAPATALIATHNPEVARQADRILFIEEHRVIACHGVGEGEC